jgi:hypothetical protein
MEGSNKKLEDKTVAEERKVNDKSSLWLISSCLRMNDLNSPSDSILLDVTTLLSSWR